MESTRPASAKAAPSSSSVRSQPLIPMSSRRLATDISGQTMGGHRLTVPAAVDRGRRRPIDPVMALTTEQCVLLSALLGPDASPSERTTAALAQQTNLSPRQVAAWLGELEARSPSLVRRV